MCCHVAEAGIARFPTAGAAMAVRITVATALATAAAAVGGVPGVSRGDLSSWTAALTGTLLQAFLWYTGGWRRSWRPPCRRTHLFWCISPAALHRMNRRRMMSTAGALIYAAQHGAGAETRSARAMVSSRSTRKFFHLLLSQESIPINPNRTWQVLAV